ncbi:MAG: hypothetical protein KC423_27115, partial [Anaerolineales bacterium]|nr:hypothetical protein [Anaerolineales bacterium]
MKALTNVRTAVGSHEGFGLIGATTCVLPVQVRTAVGSHEGFGLTTGASGSSTTVPSARPLAPM